MRNLKHWSGILCLVGLLFLGAASCRKSNEPKKGNEVVNPNGNNSGKGSDDNKGSGNDNPNTTTKQAEFDWATCEILFREGHPHGYGELHGNTVPAELSFRKLQRLVLQRQNGKITLLPGEGMNGRKYLQAMDDGALYALEMVFKDKNGKRMNPQAIGKEALPHHYMLFTVTNKGLNGEVIPPTNVRTNQPLKGSEQWDEAKWRSKTKHFFEYNYRDTNPEDRQYRSPLGTGGGVVSLLRRNYSLDRKAMKDYVGFKGHFAFRAYPQSKQDDPTLDGELPMYHVAIQLFYIPGNKYIGKREADFDGEFEIEHDLPYHYDSPQADWIELTRINLPIQIVATFRDRMLNEKRFYADQARVYGKTAEEIQEEYDKADTGSDNSTYFM